MKRKPTKSNPSKQIAAAYSNGGDPCFFCFIKLIIRWLVSFSRLIVLTSMVEKRNLDVSFFFNSSHNAENLTSRIESFAKLTTQFDNILNW